jgi:hypothetical protein
MTPADCTNPQPWREAVTRFLTDDDLQAELVAHAQGRSVLDTVFPPAECDYDPDQHPTMARRGGNCVADAEWVPVSSDSPFGAQR